MPIELEHALAAVIDAPTDNFVELVKASGLDPASDFRGADLSGTDLTGCDLAGYDFTGADFSGATLDGADFSKAVLDGATFDPGQDPRQRT